MLAAITCTGKTWAPPADWRVAPGGTRFAASPVHGIFLGSTAALGRGGGPSDGPGCSETQVLLVLYSEGWPVRSSHAKQQRDTQSELVMLTSSMLWVGSTLPSCRVGILIAARGLITHSSPVVPFLVDCRSAALHSIGYRSVGHCASCLRCKMGNDGSRMK